MVNKFIQFIKDIFSDEVIPYKDPKPECFHLWFNDHSDHDGFVGATHKCIKCETNRFISWGKEYRELLKDGKIVSDKDGTILS